MITAYRWIHGARVGSNIALFHIHQMNCVNSHTMFCHEDGTNNEVLLLLMLLLSLIQESLEKFVKQQLNDSKYSVHHWWTRWRYAKTLTLHRQLSLNSFLLRGCHLEHQLTHPQKS